MNDDPQLGNFTTPPPPQNQLLVSISLMGEQGVDRNFPFIETLLF